MIETLTIVTLIFLYLNFFRPGKTPMLESPLVIERPGQYKISLAPKLNLAQPFIEAIVGHIKINEEQHSSGAMLFFAVRDKQITTDGNSGFLLVIRYRDGMLYFQGELPPQKKHGVNPKWLNEFIEGALEKSPLGDIYNPALDSRIVEAIQEAARERNASVNLILTTGSIRAQVLTGQENSFSFCQ